MGIKFVGVLLRFGFNDKAARENPRECNECSGFKFLMSDEGGGSPLRRFGRSVWRPEVDIAARRRRMEAESRHSRAPIRAYPLRRFGLSAHTRLLC